MKKQPSIGAKSTDNLGVFRPSTKVNYKQRPVNTPEQDLEHPTTKSKQIVFADPIFAWLHEYKFIEGAFLMNKSENPKIALLCIPYHEKFRVFEFTDHIEQYALIPKNVMFQTVKDNVKQIVSAEKEQLLKLKLDDAKKAAENYDVYYVPVAIHQS